MTKTLVALAVLALVACFPPSSKGSVAPGSFKTGERSDRFKNIDAFWWTFGAAPVPGAQNPDFYSGGDLKLFYILRKGVRLPDILISFDSESRGGWRYLRLRDIVLLVDGVTVDPEDEKHDGSTSGRFVRESITATLKEADMRRMMVAKTIEFRAGGFEGAISPEAMISLRAFLRTIPEPVTVEEMNRIVNGTSATPDAGAEPAPDAGVSDGSPE